MEDRERKITAIFAADVVGFSKMMGEDEEGTLHNLEECRSIAESEIRSQRGRVFGSAGDSIIAEFPSAVTAVKCASQIQTVLAERNAGKSSADRMLLRIGINVGDVIVDGENLYGDGVNIAARLEAMAEPGGICISGSVYDLVQSKVRVGIEPVGARNLKNIAKPVKVYRVLAASAPASYVAMPNTELGLTSDEDPGVRRWMDLVSLLAILTIIGVAFWFYLSR
jgi:class 3 adenylate cyclase